MLRAWSSVTVSTSAVKFQQHNGWIFVYNFCTWAWCQLPRFICIGRLRCRRCNEGMKMTNCLPGCRCGSVNVWLVLNGLPLDYLVQRLTWAALCSQSFRDPLLTDFKIHTARSELQKRGGILSNRCLIIKHTVSLLGRAGGISDWRDWFHWRKLEF